MWFVGTPDGSYIPARKLENRMQQRLKEGYAMHPLSNDERVTCESMLSQEPSSKVLMMPTHHINEFGDMMGFRYTCNRSVHSPDPERA